MARSEWRPPGSLQLASLAPGLLASPVAVPGTHDIKLLRTVVSMTTKICLQSKYIHLYFSFFTPLVRDDADKDHIRKHTELDRRAWRNVH